MRSQSDEALRWQARCRYCGAIIVDTLRLGDHDVHVLQRHLHQCRPRCAAELRGSMGIVRKHFFVEVNPS